MEKIKKKSDEDSDSLASRVSAQAERLGISVDELRHLSDGKRCPKYGLEELLHARRVRGGKIVVFNISEKFRGEKISEGRRKIKEEPSSADPTKDGVDKKED